MAGCRPKVRYFWNYCGLAVLCRQPKLEGKQLPGSVTSPRRGHERTSTNLLYRVEMLTSMRSANAENKNRLDPVSKLSQYSLL
jgi:hypothetical protein